MFVDIHINGYLRVSYQTVSQCSVQSPNEGLQKRTFFSTLACCERRSLYRMHCNPPLCLQNFPIWARVYSCHHSPLSGTETLSTTLLQAGKPGMRSSGRPFESVVRTCLQAFGTGIVNVAKAPPTRNQHPEVMAGMQAVDRINAVMMVRKCAATRLLSGHTCTETVQVYSSKTTFMTSEGYFKRKRSTNFTTTSSARTLTRLTKKV
ncbi:uncharacterized protein EV420DRAFT_169342 [Desarmillaria tabescens]|uniref:Uncharacterized protein n=1 Tax=Armillaria tabescens TaxID=1929756 RepID=A0AA39N8G7_ARMTA|nr:uncharacterized protein EV420DRAFT_169342 [Desarmillaria tabescens]KAK0460975.1 hypothetical protein EV420DRAFT_169342 [Desarmillaria tabescens]